MGKRKGVHDVLLERMTLIDSRDRKTRVVPSSGCSTYELDVHVKRLMFVIMRACGGILSCASSPGSVRSMAISRMKKECSAFEGNQ